MVIKHTNNRDGMLFGQLLVTKKLITPDKLSEALSNQRQFGGRLGEVLIKLKMLSEEQTMSALGQLLSVEYCSLSDLSDIDIQVAHSLPERIAKRFNMVALRRCDNGIMVAMSDPLDVVAKDTIVNTLGRKAHISISTHSGIVKAIEAIYHGSEVQQERIQSLVEVMASEPGADVEEYANEEQDGTDISSEVAADKAPVIHFVDLLLSQAVKSKASDIHIEPQEKSMFVRMRVDGMLRDMIPPPRKMQRAVTARTKILSGMDIAERRIPQDGRFKIKAPGRDIDVRVSSIPTIYGEKVVMRILDKDSASHDIEQIGFEPKLLHDFKSAISKPHGIIIVTGPTGSGKSTTLYAALNFLRDPRKNITTVEDPVEYRLGGINQIQIRPEVGLSFAACLRSILRQDPDIILVGEIRDRETMEIAIQASLTGHLVLTTFHTNDAPSAMSRLIYMGLERYLLASTLNLIIAQRLIRRICHHCKEPSKPDEKILSSLGIDVDKTGRIECFHGRGCSACEGTGYSGRLAVFEFLPLDDQLREKITQGAGEMEIRTMVRKKGYSGLLESAVSRLREGLTTVEEVLRVAFVKDVDSTNGCAKVSSDQTSIGDQI